MSSTPGRSALFTTKMSPISSSPALASLDRVAPPRVEGDQRCIGRSRDLDLGLPYADGLDDDLGEPRPSRNATTRGVASAIPPR